MSNQIAVPLETNIIAPLTDSEVENEEEEVEQSTLSADYGEVSAIPTQSANNPAVNKRKFPTQVKASQPTSTGPQENAALAATVDATTGASEGMVTPTKKPRISTCSATDSTSVNNDELATPGTPRADL
eukprot:gene4369-5568_t